MANGMLDSIKDVVRSSVKVPEFDKHLKKAGRHIDRNVVEITIKMKTIGQKPLMMKENSTSDERKIFRNLALQQKSHDKEKHWGTTPYNLLWTIL